MIKLIAGLGNPGKEYTDTVHNVGFIVLDFIRDYFDCLYKEKFKNKYFCVDNILYIKPLLFMNSSGIPLKSMLDYYKFDTNEVLVIYDDIETKSQRIKIKFGGGAGGHNGIRSIDSSIGKDYWRMKVGVGRPLNDKEKICDYVLSRLKNECFMNLERISKVFAENIELVEEKKFDQFLEKINEY